ncbi:MAG: alkaline phosphatase family protein [Acidilobus sp.]
MRLSLLGLDGLPPWLLRTASSELGLRALTRAVSSGRLIPLYSMPPITPVAWTSIATGVNPAKHGVWGFTKYLRGPNGGHLSRPYTSADVMFPRAFEDAALKGLDVIVINYPLTWPLRALCCLDRMVVVGDTFLAPRVEYHPADLSKVLGDYFKTPSDVGDPYRRTELLIEGTLKLLAEVDADVSFVVLPFPDQAFHRDPYEVLRVGKRSEGVWRAIDVLVDEMLERSGSFMLVSDHGIGTYDTCVNPLAPLMREFGVGIPRSLRGRLALRLVTLADRVSLLLPKRLSPRELIRYGPLKGLRRTLDRALGVVARPGSFAPAAESELASQPFTYDAGGLSIGRILYFKDLQARDRGLRALASSGAIKYVKVTRVEEAFRGAYLPQYPGLFMESIDEDRYHVVSTRSYALTRRDPMPDHHVIGTLLLVGKETSTSQATVYDVTPTALALLDLPAPRGADGRSLISVRGEFPYDAAVRVRRRLTAD